MKLVWSPRFTRSVKKLARRKPALLDNLEVTLKQLESDPHHPALRTHKLGGDLKSSWACSAGYDFRVVFEFLRNPETNETEGPSIELGDA